MDKKQLKMPVRASGTPKKAVVKAGDPTYVEVQSGKGGPLMVDVLPPVKNGPKMSLKTSATSQKAVVKQPENGDGKSIINPRLLCVAKVNYFRPFNNKMAVVSKDSLSEKEFKAMNKLHADQLDAIEKGHKLRLVNAAKEAEVKKKLAEAERQRKLEEIWNNMNHSQFHAAFFAHKKKAVADKA
jgi:hypothetical protein